MNAISKTLLYFFGHTSVIIFLLWDVFNGFLIAALVFGSIILLSTVLFYLFQVLELQ
jgi:hypothetical protein